MTDMNGNAQDNAVKGNKYSALKPGDHVKFGSYPQNHGDIKEPIEWVVLEVKDNEALLISRYALDCQPYHEENADITWENCSLRKWLNDDFLKAAFSEEEQRRISVSETPNGANPRSRARGGNATRDRIFCLSIAEAEQYYALDTTRRCLPTEYAIEEGVFIDNEFGDNDEGCCYWLLRSPGMSQNMMAFVNPDGSLELFGGSVDAPLGAIRPALRIICNQ